jgi:hypothetical protein
MSRESPEIHSLTENGAPGSNLNGLLQVSGTPQPKPSKKVCVADVTYLEQRRLRRAISERELWGLCVGIVICGEFSGWQVRAYVLWSGLPN